MLEAEERKTKAILGLLEAKSVILNILIRVEKMPCFCQDRIKNKTRELFLILKRQLQYIDDILDKAKLSEISNPIRTEQLIPMAQEILLSHKTDLMYIGDLEKMIDKVCENCDKKNECLYFLIK